MFNYAEGDASRMAVQDQYKPCKDKDAKRIFEISALLINMKQQKTRKDKTTEKIFGGLVE